MPPNTDTVGDHSLGLVAAKQLLLPRVAQQKNIPVSFYEAGSGLVASCSCTHPRFLHNTRTYGISIRT